MKRIGVLFLVLSASLGSLTWGQIGPALHNEGPASIFPSRPSAETFELLQAMDKLAGSTQRMRLYDDFNTMFINPAKWSTGIPSLNFHGTELA